MIKNYYTLEYKSDYHISLYYVSPHVFEAKIIHLDGDEMDIILNLYDLENKNIERIILKKSNTYFCDTILRKIEYEKTQIPKRIMQTHDDITNLEKTIETIKNDNPEYEYVFFNSKQREEYLKNNFDSNVIKAYNKLIPNAFKADLFRYCYIYKEGGWYIDCKVISRTPLRNIVNKEDTFLVCSDYDAGNTLSLVCKNIFNGVFGSVKNNDLLLDVIKTCVNNILNKSDYYTQLLKNDYYILNLTGPGLFGAVLNKFITNSNIRFKHIILNNDETDYKNFLIIDRKNCKTIFTKQYKKKNGIHYSQLVKEGKLFN